MVTNSNCCNRQVHQRYNLTISIVTLNNCHIQRDAIRLTTDEAITDGVMTQQAVDESLADFVTLSPVAPAYSPLTPQMRFIGAIMCLLLFHCYCSPLSSPQSLREIVSQLVNELTGEIYLCAVR